MVAPGIQIQRARRARNGCGSITGAIRMRRAERRNLLALSLTLSLPDRTTLITKNARSTKSTVSRTASAESQVVSHGFPPQVLLPEPLAARMRLHASWPRWSGMLFVARPEDIRVCRG